ncbi:hypothetical protein [Halorussus aquaticus]|uniref:Transposase n=1 Tax=Halorussus aquaticus TaxID=2953748 RepID=A0ABD5Q654_9EURY|nr:hypothetical protein [Halorussus aquaticus]
MTTDTRRIADDSTLVGFICTAVLRLRAWLAASWLVRTTGTSTNALEVATDTSGVAGIIRTLVRWTHHSLCYRWLTKEPEPEVIVIDLRDTYTVGPFIALFHRISPVVQRTWHGSLVARVTERLCTAVRQGWITESKTVHLLRSVLEPPKPPEDRRE